MFRPATPLTVLLFAAFVCTLLPVISAPVVCGIPLGVHDGVNYGVFGYCQQGQPNHFEIGYAAPGQPDDSDIDEGFDLDNSSGRGTLSYILIIHPVGAFLQLVCVILGLAAHFHAPSHSSRYLLGLIIFMLPTFLVTLLAFLVDILLFLPHVGWAGWLTIGGVILDLIGGIMTCAMRRTLVSRKARKKRIAANAEMSGENFYNRQAQENAQVGLRAESPPPLDGQASVPMVNGAPGADKLPGFATYEAHRLSDDRLPLTERTETATTTSSTRPGRSSQEGHVDHYGPGGPSVPGPPGAPGAPGAGRGGPMNRGRGGRGGFGQMRDEYGNPLPPSSALGYNPNRDMGGRGGFRGRGGPGPRGGYRGRGGGPGGPPRGGPGMGGAFGPGAAAGALAGDMAQGRGPPPGYSNGEYPLQDRPPMNGAYGQRRQSPGPPSAPGYGPRRQSPGPPSAPGYGRRPSAGADGRQVRPQDPGYDPIGSAVSEPLARAESPPPLPGQEPASGILARAESPPPLSEPADHAHEPAVIGQAVEMDESTGSPAQTPRFNQTTFQRIDSPLRQNFPPHAAMAPQSPSSMYSSQPSQPTDSVYVPARAAWASSPANAARQQAPVAEYQRNESSNSRSNTMKSGRASETYYEDVDPRFSQDYHPGNGNIPSLLLPGSANNASAAPHLHPASNGIGVAIDSPPADDRLAPGRPGLPMHQSGSYDSVHNGPGSDSSHFTSVSERGVNPAWDGYDGSRGPAPNRGPPRQPNDVLVSNTDFQLPDRGRGGAGPSAHDPYASAY